jgi:hypothetical protein
MVQAIGEVARQTRIRPLAQQHWGEKLFCVLGNVVDAARFAMALFDVIEPIHKTGSDPRIHSLLRVALHYGPVHRRKDSLFGRPVYLGHNISHALLIEPVALPGFAFTSNKFAAALNTTAGHEFYCNFLGFRKLAQGRDSYMLYQLVYNQSARPALAKVA